MKNLLKSLLAYFNLEIRVKFNPSEMTTFDEDTINIAKKYSMTNKYRLWSLVQHIKYTNLHNLEGDFVECGVWKGGNLILMQKYIEKFNLNKSIYGFDTFSGMSEPTDFDISTNTKNSLKKFNKLKLDENSSNWCFAEIDEVNENIRSNVNKPDNILLIKGMVEETLQNTENLPDKISILRLDTDFYESTKIELEVLYPRLVKGGVLIIDDYGWWEGSRKAVDEYFDLSSLPLQYIDHTGRFLIK